MKSWKSVPVILLAVSAIVSCSKSSIKKNSDADASSSLVRQPGTRIKSMYNQYDTTRFYYNRDGGLDSVIKQPERYLMFGKGKYVDSMVQYWGIYPEFIYSNIKYNAEGRMTEYTRRHADRPNPQIIRYILHYNEAGDLIEQRMEVNDRKLENFYRYNEDHDLVWNNTYIDGAGDHICILKTDEHLNPFFKMDLMYIIFGGNEMQQMVLSKHNLSEVYREYEGRLLTFQNEYDNDGRLIKKTNLYYDEYFNISYY